MDPSIATKLLEIKLKQSNAKANAMEGNFKINQFKRHWNQYASEDNKDSKDLRMTRLMA